MPHGEGVRKQQFGRVPLQSSSELHTGGEQPAASQRGSLLSQHCSPMPQSSAPSQVAAFPLQSWPAGKHVGSATALAQQVSPGAHCPAVPHFTPSAVLAIVLHVPPRHCCGLGHGCASSQVNDVPSKLGSSNAQAPRSTAVITMVRITRSAATLPRDLARSISIAVWSPLGCAARWCSRTALRGASDPRAC